MSQRNEQQHELSRLDEQQIWEALKEVPDPELPAISVIDMGIVRHIQLDAQQNHVRVDIAPTFAGCPALARIRSDIETRLQQLVSNVEVRVTMQQPWTSDMLSSEARQKLHGVGIAPPPSLKQSKTRALPTLPLLISQPLTCPYCGSQQTTLENAFGPTPCRAIAYCTNCHQPFEQFKPI